METDVILFAGQSNMAGRGDAGEAVVCEPFMGWEFRAVSAPAKLCPIVEPFGAAENSPTGLDDGRKKTGSMVSAFVRKYYERTGHTVIAVSASKGGSSSAQWIQRYAADAAMRLQRAVCFAEENGIRPAHVYVLWSQGETDGDKGLGEEEYREAFQKIWGVLRKAGAEKCFLIQTGHYNYVDYPGGWRGLDGKKLDERYGVIRRAQRRMCTLLYEGEHEEARGERREVSGKETARLADVYLVASFEPYLHLMRDQYHYRQQAYNEVGETAAGNVARFLACGAV